MKGFASIEMLIIVLLVMTVVGGFVEGYFPRALSSTEKLVRSVSAYQAVDKIRNTVDYLSKTAPGTTVKVLIYLPPGSSLSCPAGGSSLTLSVGGSTDVFTLPLQCRSDFSLDGPFRGLITMGKFGVDQVVIG